jgi:hypothetical protein
LNAFQTFAEEIGVSMPKLDVVGGCGSDAEARGEFLSGLHSQQQGDFSAVR